MTFKYGSSGSGGGNSGFSYGRSPVEIVVSSAPKDKPKKKKGHHGTLGLLANFKDDVEAAAHGFFPGIKHLASEGGHDVGQLLSQAGANLTGHGADHKTDYHLDDMAKQVIQATAHTYAPLMHGDMGEFGHRLYSHPLGPVLDALTIATLGAGGATQGTKLLASEGASEAAVARAAKAAGASVQKVVHAPGVTNADEALNVLNAAKRNGHGKIGLKLDDQTILAPSPRILVPGPIRALEEVSGPGRLTPFGKPVQAVAAERAPLLGKGAVEVGSYSENAFRRMQQRAFDAISEAVPGFAERRISRAQRSVARQRDARGFGRADRAVAGDSLSKFMNSKEVRKLEPHLQVELRNRAEGKTAVEQLAKHEESLTQLLDSYDHGKAYDYARAKVGRKKDVVKVADAELARLAHEHDHLTNAVADSTGQARHARVMGKGDTPREGVAKLEEALNGAGWRSDATAQEVPLAHIRNPDKGFWVRNPADGSLKRVDDAIRHEEAGTDLAHRVEEYTPDIQNRGFDDAIHVEVRKDGKKVITDGVARLLAAEKAGRDNVPVTLVGAPGTGVLPSDYNIPTRQHGHQPEQIRKAQRRASKHDDLIVKANKRLKNIEARQQVMQGLKEKGAAGLEEMRQIAHARGMKDVIQPQLETRIAIDRQLVEHGLTNTEEPIVNRLLKLQRAVAEQTTAKLHEGADLRGGKNGSKGPRSKDEILGDVRRAEQHLDPEQLDVELGGSPTILDLTVGAAGDALEKGGFRIVIPEGVDAEAIRRMPVRRIIESQGDLRHVIQDERFIVPHSIDRTLDRTKKQQGQMHQRLDAPPRPDASKLRTGFADKFGLDATDPRNLLAVNKTVRAWTSSMQTWKQLTENFRPMEGLHVAPDGWKEVPADSLNRFYENARQFAEEAKVAFGDPQVVQQMTDQLSSGMQQMGTRQMVPAKMYDRVMKEIKPVGKLPVYDDLVGMWRTATVSVARPAFLANNIVGQSMLLAMAHASLKSFGAMVKYGSDPVLRKQMRSLMGAVEGTGESSVLGRQTSDMLSKGIITKHLGMAKNVNDAMSKWGQAISDDPFRRFAFAAEILPPARKLVDLRNAKRAAGEAPFTLESAMNELMDNNAFADKIERKVLGDLVDFSDLSHSERAIVRKISPFYSWIKGSSKITSDLVMQSPGTANIMYRTGQSGAKANEKEFGALPGFAKGLIGMDAVSHIPGLGGVGKDGKHRGVLSTAQYNPFVTPADVIAQLNYMVGQHEGDALGGDNPVSGFAPPIKAAFSAFTGKDPFTGAAVGGGNALSKFAHSTIQSFPQVGAIQSATRKQYAGGMYRSSPQVEIAKYMGLPVRDLNQEAANKRALNPPVHADATVLVSKAGVPMLLKDGRIYLQMPKKKKGSK